jgi:thioredoxin-dependent peroxiredoxin
MRAFRRIVAPLGRGLAPLGLLALLATAGPAAALEVGQKAPDFTLPAPGGKQVKLSELTARGPVVLYTFIQAFTGT